MVSGWDSKVITSATWTKAGAGPYTYTFDTFTSAIVDASLFYKASVVAVSPGNGQSVAVLNNPLVPITVT